MTRTTVVVLALGLAGLTGCGAGQEALNYSYRASADYTDTGIGPITVRNVAVLTPDEGAVHRAGEDAVLRLTLVNAGAEDDALIGARTDAAEQVVLPGDEELVLGAEERQRQRPEELLLSGLTRDLPTASYVELTLVFALAGELTFQVPVAITGEEPEEVEYEVPHVDSEGDPVLHGPEEEPDGEAGAGEGEGESGPESEGSDQEGGG